MDHVEMEEIHNSLEELAQPPLFSLRTRGDSSMSYFLCMRKTYGKGIDCFHNDLYKLNHTRVGSCSKEDHSLFYTSWST